MPNVDLRSEHRMIRHAVSREGRVAHMRNAMRRNMDSGNTSYVGKPRFKVFGMLVAALFRHRVNNDYVAVQRTLALINNLRKTPMRTFTSYGRRTASSRLGYALSEEGFHVCPHCMEHIVDERGEDTHYYNENDSLLCSDCVDNHYTWSEYMDCYILSRHAVEVQCRRDTTYITYDYAMDNPREFVRDVEGYWYTREGADYHEVELDSDFEPEPKSDGLSRYHGSNDRYFQEYSADGSIALGLELEVWASDRGETVRYLKENYRKGSARLMLEEDGSLSDTRGMEIITQPLGRTEWMNMAPQLLSYLRNNGVRGYSHPDHCSYGIHISVNRDRLAPLQEARLLRFLVDKGNGDFVRVIGQRNAIYGACDGQNYAVGCCESDVKLRGINSQSVVQHSYTSPRRKLSSSDVRYAALNFKSLPSGVQVVEFRIFYSTLKTSSFLKNLEFVWALCRWTSLSAATGTSVDHKEFVAWLFANKTRRLEYPNLCSYLLRDNYRVKNGRGTIQNTWKDGIKVTPRQVMAIHKHAA